MSLSETQSDSKRQLAFSINPFIERYVLYLYYQNRRLCGCVDEKVASQEAWIPKRVAQRIARCVLTPDRVRHVILLGNQIHSVNLWTLRIPKMYMRILGYNVQIIT